MTGPLLPANCTLPLLVPGGSAIACYASVVLTADDFVVSYMHVNATAVADGVPAVNFSDRVDLDVTRAVTVDVMPHFRKPSEWWASIGLLLHMLHPMQAFLHVCNDRH